ncbi:bifunctional diaminohydroxyphosphoribosylaminopyrimidine deaminase/5-amino-6-(5-phosphoribosylamino)uracil reductase RibD [Alkanindiges sp. WGS2144]|uniref:bifunctional diaminohydroxyphosphoribosylaminopyrimidine deaminase/5-amino-6-(5-phosphoribosylamino)uracil reductase RibD n=1 Tax=Alkanindiges sp. WGS2144 TaxID=3366808 RepID=UPI003752B150
MNDQQLMQQAIVLARHGQYSTRPNPCVGCVIVKDGRVIGEGFHPQAGQPHAEVFALRQAGEAARGATAYVTLEPCAHYGKTPPCAQALIDAGVSRVVMASLDPNPLVAGQGRAMLEAAGIATTVGVLEHEARALNKGFLQVMAGGRPFVRLKMAASLDGRTAMASGESKWITGSEARLDVQHWRAMSGAVITGINTVLADDPSLNVRQLAGNFPVEQVVQPLRVVLDRNSRFPLEAQLLQQPAHLLLVGTLPEIAPHVEHWPDMSLASLLDQLKQQKQVYDVLVEAGPTLAGEFLRQNLVDELIVYLAPTLLGSQARPMFNLSLTQMCEQYRLELQGLTQVGADIRLILKPEV